MKKSKNSKKASKIVRKYDKNKKPYFINKETGKRVSKIIWEAQFIKNEKGKRERVEEEIFNKSVELINKNPNKIKNGSEITKMVLNSEKAEEKRKELIKDLEQNKGSFSYNYWELAGKINDLDEKYQTINIRGVTGVYKKYKREDALNLMRQFIDNINELNLIEERKIQKAKKQGKDRKNTKIYIQVPFLESFDIDEAFIDFSGYENLSTLSGGKIDALIFEILND